MESTTTDQQFFSPEASLSEPHFDQEATVLSARPVVPLTNVNDATPVHTGKTFPRPWILGLALAGTLLLGIVATAIYYSGLDGNNSSSLVDVEAAASGEASPTQSEAFSGPTAVQPTIDTVTPAEAKRTAPVKSQQAKSSATDSGKPAPRLVAVIRETDNGVEPTESREDRKAARRQERQERRRAERERRKSSDDVLRIRDIFEGSPRP